MRLMAIGVTLLAVVVALGIALAVGRARWGARTRRLLARLHAGRVAPRPAVFDVRELDGLPQPVQRYFRAVLTPGQPMVTSVHIEHSGSMDMGEKAPQWKTFTSRQDIVTRRAGFLWDARIDIAPGVPALVHDAYVGGEGQLHAAVFGLVPVMNMRGTPEIDEGELLRWFAEASWYPTALLPSQGVAWSAVDDSSARATMQDGGTKVALLFRFDDEGLIRSMRAEARGRMVDGANQPTPWEGRWWDYASRDGMRVPMAGEVSWMLPAGPKPYWRGRITRMSFEHDPGAGGGRHGAP